MPHHIWNDEWFEKYGNSLDSAIRYIMSEWRRRGRIGTHGKEKYGTFRHSVYLYSGSWPIHELVNPGYVYYQWPRWLMHMELQLGKLVQLLGISRVIRRYQYRVYREVLHEACRKWPEVAPELIDDIDDINY